METVWIVEYSSGYISDGFTEAFNSEEKARVRFLELVESSYPDNDNEPTIEEVLNFINNGGEDISTDETSVDKTSLSWDGYEVYESLSYYQLEIN
jgi:hypothetical protein